MCSGGAKEPETGAQTPSSETCRAHRCCFNRPGHGLSVSFWDWVREVWFLKFFRVGLYFLLAAMLPFQGFSIVGVRVSNSEHSRHSSFSSSDILMQAVIVASWGRRGELPVALRGCGAWEEGCLSHLTPACFTLRPVPSG